MIAEAIVLGSGTSNGVPMLGVHYAPEYLAHPKNHRTRASILIEGPEGNLLVDCAPEMRLQMVRENLHDIDAVLITHTHADHVMGMDDLRSICIKTRRPMPIFTTPEYEADIRRIFPYAFGEVFPGIEVPRFEITHPGEIFNACGLAFQILRVKHGKLTVLGLRVGDFAYLTDVSEIPPEAEAHLGGLQTLILDAVRRKPHPNHFYFDKSIEVALSLRAKQTYFTHLSDDFDHDVTNAELPPGIALAYDGLRIPIH